MPTAPVGWHLRYAVIRRDGMTCQYCGVDCSADYGIDHVIPRSYGGDNALYNLTMACARCNRGKRQQTWIPLNLDSITAEHPEWRARIIATATPHDSSVPYVNRPKQVSANLTLEDYDRLVARAAARGVSVTRFIRELILDELNTQDTLDAFVPPTHKGGRKRKPPEEAHNGAN